LASGAVKENGLAVIYMKRRFASRNGQTLIEFAFVLPLLLALTIGMIEFGFFLYNQQMITNASREGARRGIVSRTDRVPVIGVDSITAVVDSYCQNHLITFGTRTPPRVIVSGHDDHALFGADLTVRVEFDYTFIMFSYTATTMAAQTVMKYE
jgi:Flp pilus assembly protein TadG